MDLSKDFKAIIKWAQKSDENKKKVIKFLLITIKTINCNKEMLTDKELENITGAGSFAPSYFFCYCRTDNCTVVTC